MLQRFETAVVFGELVPRDVVRERTYGAIRVTATWPALLEPETHVTLKVHGDLDPRDAPAYVELFFHDLFLLLNLAAPGSFRGTIVTTGDLRVRDLTFDSKFFVGERIPLDNVIAWYDGLQLGTQQLATSGIAIALFQLLHLARAEENEENAIVRLAIAAEALECAAPKKLFELRDAIALGRAPVFHPMHDDALDPRVEDATREWIDIADEAAALIIAALQQRVLRTNVR